ncbi:MAG: hypothetical protein ACPH3L_09105 [Flavobacteriaceae bacterium]
MIDILKKEIEKKIGKKVTNRGDCELVSNVILENLEEEISYSTIRRLYGLVNETKPNNRTLNTLSKFIGYKNYIHFSQNYSYKQKIDLTEIIYKTVSRNNAEEIIKLVNKTKNSSEDFISMAIILIRELWHNENYNLINRIFNLKALNFNSFSYYEALKLGNSIGLLIRKKSKIDPILLNNINFLECVFLIFVDYSSLNKYYGDALKIIKKNNIRNDITLFSSALLEFRNFINNKNVNEIALKTSNTEHLHPILSGRLLSLKLLNADSDKTFEILNTYHTSLSIKGHIISHYYELFTTAILLKNIEIMSFLINRINLKIEFYYQKTHLNSFYLMCLFYFKLTGDLENEAKFLKSFNLVDSRDSYREFITLIHLIYLYASTTTGSKKKKIKTQYLYLSKKLNYSYFSEDFLVTYFNNV